MYPYHGLRRTRDAALLAKNSIVVTTYQTLASDATYHANKGGLDYCAPCEHVRWWRIICDESHSLREANTQKSAAVLNLVADHKWLVSGLFPPTRRLVIVLLVIIAKLFTSSCSRNAGQHVIQGLEESAEIHRYRVCRRNVCGFHWDSFPPHT